MTTLAFQITPTGPVAPDFATIVSTLTAGYQAIYGNDIYVDPDSQDGQQINIFAAAINDANNAGIAVYMAYSPTYATGSGLSSEVKINGLQREVPTKSTAVVTIVGQIGTVITGGIIGDNLGLGTQWTLPTPLTIPDSGTLTETATCTTAGAVAAAADSLTVIVTPTPGWQSVINPAIAALGNPVEDDATLRQRQSVSTGKSALTPLSAIYGTLANLTGVTRLLIYENDTASTDANGIPRNSICVVIEGGDVVDIAQAIEAKKSPGTGTFGSTSQAVTDPEGLPITINFDVLGYEQIYVAITLTPISGYTSTIGTYVVAALVQAINNLAIGGEVYYNRLWAPANLSGSDAVAAVTALTGMATTQAQLDAFSATYDVTALSIANYFGGGTSSGTTNDLVNATAAPTFFTLLANVPVTVKANHTNTGAATLNFAGSGVKSIRKVSGASLVPLTGGEIVSGTAYTFVYNGTYWVLQATLTGTEAGPTVTADIVVPFNDVAQTQTSQITLSP